MKIKLDSKGNAVLQGGHPLYKLDDGSEIAFDAGAAMKFLRGQAFAGSKFIADKLTIHPELAAAAFGGSFQLEKGQLVAYGAGCVPLYSHRRPGELANLDEALEQLVAKYPNRDMILRKDGAPSSTAPAGQQQTGTSVSRAAFDAMPQDTRARFLSGGGKVSDGAGGAAPASPPTTGGRKSITRAAFDVLGTQERAAHFKAGGKVVD